MPTTTSLVGGRTGAGVPCPVAPKSQIQRSATENPSTAGTTAINRHAEVPLRSTLNPSHRGSSQNHSPKNANPTTSEPIVDHTRDAMSASARIMLPVGVRIQTVLLQKRKSADRSALNGNRRTLLRDLL